MSGATELRRCVVLFCEVSWIGRPAMRLVKKRTRRVSMGDILGDAVVLVGETFECCLVGF